MDFPLAPHTIRKVENKADHGGEDVVVYDRGIKNVHQDFVIVFAVTFAVIVVLIVSVVITFHTIKKCNSVINQRKQVPNLCVTTEAGTIIYEKEPSGESLYHESSAKAFENINEITRDAPDVISSRERRKKFAENRSKTSAMSSTLSSHLNSIEETETCSHHSPRGSQPSCHSHNQGSHQSLHLHDRGLHLPIISSHITQSGRRHTCTHVESQSKSFGKKISVPKQLSLQY